MKSLNRFQKLLFFHLLLNFAEKFCEHVIYGLPNSEQDVFNPKQMFDS